MTARQVPITDDFLDELAAALVPKVNAIADVAWEASGRPRGSRHGWVDGTRTDTPDQGRGVTVCGECGKPTADHSLTGGHPV